MTVTTTPRPPVKVGGILAIILISYFMVLLDNSVIFTGLPSIRDGLDLSPTALSWVQDAYTLTFGGLLLLGSRAGDLLGSTPRVRYRPGCLRDRIAADRPPPAGWWIISARAMQGIGAAIVAPTSLALITAYFQGDQRKKAVAAYAATAGIGASLGLLVGGALTDLISWRAAFLVNVPIAAAMIIGSRMVLVETTPRRGRFDVTGAVLATSGMGAVVFAIIESAESGAAARVIGTAVLGAALLAAVGVNESRVAQPIMPLRLFADRERSGAYATRFLYLGAMIGFFYFTTQLLQDGFGFTPLQAGLAFLPMTIVNFIVALAVPRFAHFASNSTLLVAGVAITLTGMAWLSRVGIGDTYVTSVALPMVLIGIGQGLAFAPMTNSGIARVRAVDAGAASGVLNTAHQLGMATGLGVLVTLSVGATSEAGAAAVFDHVGTALTGASAFLAAALLVVLVVLVPRTTQNMKGTP